MKMNAKNNETAIMAPLSIFGSMFQGVIMSLIVGAFVTQGRKSAGWTPEIID